VTAGALGRCEGRVFHVDPRCAVDVAVGNGEEEKREEMRETEKVHDRG
jgi:hypothetical protein